MRLVLLPIAEMAPKTLAAELAGEPAAAALGCRPLATSHPGDGKRRDRAPHAADRTSLRSAHLPALRTQLWSELGVVGCGGGELCVVGGLELGGVEELVLVLGVVGWEVL